MCRQDLGILQNLVHAGLLQIISREDPGTIFSLQLPGMAPIFRVHCGGNVDRCIFAACSIERDALVFRRPVPWEVGEKVVVDHLVCPVSDDVVFDWNSCSVTIYEEPAAHIGSSVEAVSFASRFSTYIRKTVPLRRVAESGAGAGAGAGADGSGGDRGGGLVPSQLERLIKEMRKAMRGDVLDDGMREPDQDEAAIVALEVALGRKLGRLRKGRKGVRKSVLRKGRFVNKKRARAQQGQGGVGAGAVAGADGSGGDRVAAGQAAEQAAGQAAGQPGRRRGGGTDAL